jgi:hypothetical protein
MVGLLRLDWELSEMVDAHFGKDQAEGHRYNNQESRHSVDCQLAYSLISEGFERRSMDLLYVGSGTSACSTNRQSTISKDPSPK